MIFFIRYLILIFILLLSCVGSFKSSRIRRIWDHFFGLFHWQLWRKRGFCFLSILVFFSFPFTKWIQIKSQRFLFEKSSFLKLLLCQSTFYYQQCNFLEHKFIKFEFFCIVWLHCIGNSSLTLLRKMVVCTLWHN